MSKIDHTANTDFVAAKPAERQSTGLVECVIVSFAGLAIGLLLVAHGLFPEAMQLALLQ
jgi:hypothetical protein